MSEEHIDLEKLIESFDSEDLSMQEHLKLCEACAKQYSNVRTIINLERNHATPAPLAPLLPLLAKQQSVKRSWLSRIRQPEMILASLLLSGMFFAAGYVQGRGNLLHRPPESIAQRASTNSALPVPSVFYDTTQTVAWDWDFGRASFDSL